MLVYALEPLVQNAPELLEARRIGIGVFSVSQFLLLANA